MWPVKTKFFSALIKILSKSALVHVNPESYVAKNIFLVDNESDDINELKNIIRFGGEYMPLSSSLFSLNITSKFNFRCRLRIGMTESTWYLYSIDPNKINSINFPTLNWYTDEEMCSKLELISLFLKEADAIALEPINSAISKIMPFQVFCKENDVCRSIIFEIANLLVSLLDIENFGFRFKIVS